MNKFNVLVAAALIAPLATSNVLVAMDNNNNTDPVLTNHSSTELSTISSNEPLNETSDNIPSCCAKYTTDGQRGRKLGLLIAELLISSVAFSALSAVAIKKVEALAKRLPVRPKHKESKDALKKILGSTVAFSLFGAVGSYVIYKLLQRGAHLMKWDESDVKLDNVFHHALSLPRPEKK